MTTRVIWKFQLSLSGDPIEMPEGAEIVFVGQQFGDPMVWAIVDPNAKTVDRMLVVRGTGWEWSSDERYLGSVQIPPFVWHVFDGGEVR